MPSVLGGGSTVLGAGNTLSLLDVGKRLGAPSVGISSSSRAQINQFLNKTQGVGNALLSAGVAETSSTEALKTQILALRSSLPESDIADGLLDNGKSAKDSTKGNKVDTSA